MNINRNQDSPGYPLSKINSIKKHQKQVIQRKVLSNFFGIKKNKKIKSGHAGLSFYLWIEVILSFVVDVIDLVDVDVVDVDVEVLDRRIVDVCLRKPCDSEMFV